MNITFDNNDKNNTNNKDNAVNEDNEVNEEIINWLGYPPSINIVEKNTRYINYIKQFGTDELLKAYDDPQVSVECKYYLYYELKDRFEKGELNKAPASKKPNNVEPPNAEAPLNTNNNYASNSENDIVSILGYPPQVSEQSMYSSEWENNIRNTSTYELLMQYDSPDWCNEYKYLIYSELTKRSDLIEVIGNM